MLLEINLYGKRVGIHPKWANTHHKNVGWGHRNRLERVGICKNVRYNHHKNMRQSQLQIRKRMVPVGKLAWPHPFCLLFLFHRGRKRCSAAMSGK